ncbi:MAG: hypothetical protein ACI9FU_002083, partial [Granulosicoccus sp.]
MYLKSLLFVLAHLTSYAVFAQDVVVLVKFQVDGSGMNGAEVKLTKNEGQTIAQPGKSKMTFSLEYGNIYQLSFAKEGYITKKISINTKRVPLEIQEEGDTDFDFAIEIFKQYEGVNTVVFNQPVAKYAFDPQVDEFIYDTDYTKSIRSALISFEEDYEEAQDLDKVDPAIEAAKKK